MKTLKEIHTEIEKKRESIKKLESFLMVNALISTREEFEDSLSRRRSELKELQIEFDNKYN